LGAGAGLFVHNGTARTAGAAPAVAERSSSRTVQPRVSPRRPAQAVVTAGPSRIGIPRLHLKSRVFPAVELDRGPAWWPITGRPGGGGTIAVAGHPTTHSHPSDVPEHLRTRA